MIFAKVFCSTLVQILGKNVALLFMHENAEFLPLHRPASIHVHLDTRQGELYLKGQTQEI